MLIGSLIKMSLLTGSLFTSLDFIISEVFLVLQNGPRMWVCVVYAAEWGPFEKCQTDKQLFCIPNCTPNCGDMKIWTIKREIYVLVLHFKKNISYKSVYMKGKHSNYNRAVNIISWGFQGRYQITSTFYLFYQKPLCSPQHSRRWWGSNYCVPSHSVIWEEFPPRAAHKSEFY